MNILTHQFTRGSSIRQALEQRIGPSLLRALLVVTLLLMTASGADAQSKLTYAQNIFLLKTLKPSLKNIGVIASTLSDQEVKAIGKAALGQGIKVTIAKVTDVSEISGLYKMLINEHNAELVWIPDRSDEILLGVGFEFLRENTILDRVGLIVPTKDLVAKGALCSLETANEKVVVYVNKRIAQVDGINPPTSQDPSVQYVLK